MRLIILGLGYSARHALALLKPTEVVGTTRDPERARRLTAAGRRVLVSGADDAALDAALADGGYILASAGPAGDGDPFLAQHGAALAAAGAAGRLKGVVYLSTIGVYGDTGGAWVDETSPVSDAGRAQPRLKAEAGWRALGAEHGFPVAVLRLGGIYGPARNAFVNLQRGTARRVVKPEQVFNRIHVTDVAQAIAAALRQGHDGVVNVTDGQPSSADAPILLAARLMGVAAPEPVPYDPTTFSALARSFWEENRRVRADVLTERLGVALRYPDFEAGLTALWQDGTWAGDDDDRAEASAKFRR
jgi:nucleoside-diphosphate-sugar epimerase